MDKKTQEKLIRLAQKEAAKSIAKGNPPFGSVLTDKEGNVIAKAHNTQNSSTDPTAHAEINLLRKVGKLLKTRYLEGYHLFGNASPCSMCVSACIKARICDFHYGAPPESSMDPFVSVFDLAKKSKRKIRIYPDILKESCVQQIKEGRKQNA